MLYTFRKMDHNSSFPMPLPHWLFAKKGYCPLIRSAHTSSASRENELMQKKAINKHPSLDLLFEHIYVYVCRMSDRLWSRVLLYIKNKKHKIIENNCIIFYIWALWSDFSCHQICNHLLFNSVKQKAWSMIQKCIGKSLFISRTFQVTTFRAVHSETL